MPPLEVSFNVAMGQETPQLHHNTDEIDAVDRRYVVTVNVLFISSRYGYEYNYFISNDLLSLLTWCLIFYSVFSCNMERAELTTCKREPLANAMDSPELIDAGSEPEPLYMRSDTQSSGESLGI